MSMFDKLCGAENKHNVMLVTTFWNAVPAATGESRESELGEIESMWKSMKDRGSTVERMARDYDRFKPILAAMSRKGSMKLRITEEMKQGKSLEQTMAGMALTHPNDELSSIREAYNRRIAERKAEAARKRTEAAVKLAAAQKAEEEFKKQEDAKLATRLKEAGKEHERKKREREKQIEESRMKAEKLAASQAKWKAQQEKKYLRDRQQEIGRIHLRASDLLQSNVENSIDMIRSAYAAQVTRITVEGISSRGIGFSTVDAQGNKVTGNWSVDRSQINIWCDACSVTIGSSGVMRKSYTKYLCPQADHLLFQDVTDVYRVGISPSASPATSEVTVALTATIS